MVRGVTRSGFAFEVAESVFHDMELIDQLAEASGDNPLAFSGVCRRIFGSEQRQRLYDHLRQADGTVPFEAVGEAIADVLAAYGTAGKN